MLFSNSILEKNFYKFYEKDGIYPVYNFFITEEYFNNSKEFKNLLYV